MKWVIRGLIGAVVSVTLAVVGWQSGLALGGAWISGAFAQWQRLPDPPQPAVRIAGGSTDAIVVEAADGSLFKCTPGSSGCWSSVADAQDLDPTREDCERYPVHYSLSDPPQKPVDYLKTYWCYFEAGSEVDYAVMADGSVWAVKNQDGNFLNLAAIFGTASLGCGAGLVGGAAVTTLLLWFLSTRKSA